MGALHVAGSFEVVFLRGTSALSKPRWRVARRVGENVIESVTLSRDHFELVQQPTNRFRWIRAAPSGSRLCHDFTKIYNLTK
jgi:hypothetical protein